jgi:CRISPR/Cas system-associated exonuclease Cas4 (RecB family)
VGKEGEQMRYQPETISWSRLREWLTCHWRYNLSYEEYLTTRKVAEPLYLGSIFHDLMEYIYGETPSKNPGFKRRTRKAIRAKLKRLGMENEELEKMLDWAMRYLTHMKRRSVEEPDQVIATEFPFSVPIVGQAKVRFVGIIDLIVERRGRVEIWDHKLQANHPRTGELDHPSISYPQMGLYAWASKELGYFIDRSTLNVFGKRRKENNTQRYPIRIKPREALMWGNWLGEKTDEILTNPDRSKSLGSMYCGFCDFRYACVNHQTKGKRGLDEAIGHAYEAKDTSYRKKKWFNQFPPSMLRKMKKVRKEQL